MEVQTAGRLSRSISALVATLGAVGLARAAADVGPPKQDPNGVLHYAVTSSYQASAPNDLRVLLPKQAGVGQRRFLYVLPVEPGTQAAFGDPVDTVRALGVVDAFQLILVVPAFSITPWYGDHPTDPAVRQESYFVNDIVPAVEMLYPESPAQPGAPRRLLLGFSKSGTGAMSLILRHGQSFDAAAAWDAPLNQPQLLSGLVMSAVFGTQANYDLYAIPKLLPLHAAEHTGAARLWLGGYSSQGAWRNDMIAAHDTMAALGMSHAWVDGPQRAHRWDSGWLEAAVTFLHQVAPPTAPDAGGAAGTDSGAPGDAGLDSPVDAPLSQDSGIGGGIGSGGSGGSVAPTGSDGCTCHVPGGGRVSLAGTWVALAGALLFGGRRRRHPRREPVG